MTRVGQTSTNGVLFQVPDIGVRRRDAQRHVSVVGQLHLLQNNGVTALFSLIGVCTQVSFVSSREGRVAVDVVYVDNFFIFVISDSASASCVVDTNFVVTGCSNNIVYRAVIQFSTVVYVAVTVDSQVTIRVHSNNTVTVVRLGSIPGTVVHQISVQNVIAAMDIEHTRYYVTVMVSDVAAGQFQFVSTESFSIELINVHIQYTAVSYGDSIGVQVVISPPPSRFGQRNSTVGVNSQMIGINVAIFTNVQRRTVS